MIIRKLGPAAAVVAGVLAVGLTMAPAQAGTGGTGGSTTASATASPTTAAATTAPPSPGTSYLAQAPVLPMTMWDHGTTSTGGPWNALLLTRGLTDGYVVDNTFAPGAWTGWHSHLGPSVIFVVQGTITDYDSSTPGCKGRTFSKGTSFTDAGGTDVHMLRNEDSEVAETIAVQFIPSGQPRKTAADEPATCHVS